MAPTIKHFLCFVFIIVKVHGQCNAGIYQQKTHSWNKGYVAKLYLDQSWLSMETADWRITLPFTNQVSEFKVWDADIINPSTTEIYVNNVTTVEVQNKCWNPHMYPCQYLILQYLVRFPETSVATTMHDVMAGVVENTSYKDGSTGTSTFCAPIEGEPPVSAGTTPAP